MAAPAHDILRGRAADKLDDGISIGFAAINGGKKTSPGTTVSFKTKR
jgi:hypothetical protein